VQYVQYTGKYWFGMGTALFWCSTYSILVNIGLEWELRSSGALCTVYW